MFLHRTASHDIARLGMRNAVSLHRDSESAEKSLSQLEKYFSLTGKLNSNQNSSNQTPSPATSPSNLLPENLRKRKKNEREPSRKGTSWKRGNPFWKSSARDEAKRGQNAYEPKHESIHQVSHRGRVLCRRHIPLQLVYCGSRNRKEPATTSGEQHLHPGRLFPFRSDHYHPVKAAKGNQPIISINPIKFNPDSKPRNESFSLPSTPQDSWFSEET